ncbi:hypothetical protein LP420_39850 [Massilia sp. B-10]|nr:hypothetical protein LP420_39850 [Massilia sp. B-10]
MANVDLVEGENLFSATATDTAGNVSTPALPISVTHAAGGSPDLAAGLEDLTVLLSRATGRGSNAPWHCRAQYRRSRRQWRDGQRDHAHSVRCRDHAAPVRHRPASRRRQRDDQSGLDA